LTWEIQVNASLATLILIDLVNPNQSTLLWPS
jgi:hypothetical protein